MLELLRVKREEAKLTQVEIAKSLGVRQAFVSKCELGQRRMDVIELREWCIALGTSVSAFMDELESTLLAFEDTVAALASQKKPKRKAKLPTTGGH
ncbi:Helix-turn-helix domain-containing protein [Cupriavidus sp. YR651]|nr:Helix-turn-helix domain-containing protein [Cupriavidus sp. YR651]